MRTTFRKKTDYLSSCSLAIVVPKHTAEPLSTKNFAITSADFLPWFDHSISKTLVITFHVEMVQERANCVS